MDAATDCEPEPSTRPRDECADPMGVAADGCAGPHGCGHVLDLRRCRLPRAWPRADLRRPPWVHTGRISAAPMGEEVGRRWLEEVGRGRGRWQVVVGRLGRGPSSAVSSAGRDRPPTGINSSPSSWAAQKLHGRTGEPTVGVVAGWGGGKGAPTGEGGGRWNESPSSVGGQIRAGLETFFFYFELSNIR
jgi:hypothetical protein